MAKKKDAAQSPACEAVAVERLKQNFDVAQTAYNPVFRKMVILDAMDNAKLWQAIKAKFPSYQIRPDTNWVSYVRANIHASIYTVAKCATVLPTSEDDRDAIENLNVALEYIWDYHRVGDYQMAAGDNAALFNLGITQVGWQKGGASKKDGGVPVFKNVNPLRYMRDPYAEDLDSAAYVITWEQYHETVIAANPRYKEAFADFRKTRDIAACEADSAVQLNSRETASITDKGYYKVYTHFVKYIDEETGDVKLSEVHLLENRVELYRNDNVLPAVYPFAELYCNLPRGDIIGTSEPAKIMSNNIAYNIINSMMLTAEYRNQRPPKFINATSGVNVQEFAKHGDEVNRTFICNGDASRAVHYHQYPAPSAMAQSAAATMIGDIKTITGVDDRYTGRDTGSVITTGGVEGMLDRVTLIDTPKIVNYETYTRALTKLVLANMVEYSVQREYVRQNPETNKFEGVEVDYDAITKPELLQYSINISSDLPKTKQRLAAMANTLMEKQMQYGGNGNGPDIITPEEWLACQDLPNKEYMLRRMKVQRMSDLSADVAETIFGFSNLARNGVAPDDAIALLAQSKMARQSGKEPMLDLENMQLEEQMAAAQEQEPVPKEVPGQMLP